MIVHTKTVIDIETGAILSDCAYEYTGPVALCDRAAQAAASQQQAQANKIIPMAQGVEQQAAGTSRALGANAQGIYGPLTTFGEGMMTAPPGYGAALPGMEATASAAGGAVRDSLSEEARQRASNTGNMATLSSNQDAIAEAAARGTGQNIQDILANNELLKNQQMMQGSDLLKGIYGENLSGSLEALGQETGAVNAATGAVNAGTNAVDARTKAGQSGWLQNATGIFGTLTAPFRVGATI